jgi:hypothetical protein
VVENPGKTLQDDTAKPINLPEHITVREDSSGRPAAVKMVRQKGVAAIIDHWRIDDEWWRRELISRIYYVVILSSGQRMVLFKDLITGVWYRQEHQSNF